MTISKRAAMTVGCLIGGAAIAIPAAAALADRGTDHPSMWDPRVAELVTFVERERGLDFDHPVRVRFVPDDEFREEVTFDEADLTDDDLAELSRQEAIGRVFGLLGPDDDLFEQSNTLTGEGVLAYYSWRDSEIVVRGTEIDEATTATLVHELVHALQDQAFDLQDVQDRATDSGAELAITGLIEGDATTVENAWIDDLDDDALDAYLAQMGTITDDVEEGSQDVSPALAAIFGAPYELGPGFVGALRSDGGRARLDEAFRSPPLADVYLVRPDRFLAGDQPQELEAPRVALDVPDGEQPEPDVLGALGVYLTLASVIDPVQALAAADGWDGDVYVPEETGAQVCATLHVVGEDAEATDRLAAAFEAWAAEREGSEDVRRDGELVMVEACDPGTRTDQATDDEIALPFVRAALVDEFVGQGMPVSVAICASGRIAGEYPADVLFGDELDDDELAELRDDVATAVRQCEESVG